MKHEHASVGRAAGLCRITLNRPQHKNALSFAMCAALGDELEAASREEEIRVVLLEGGGGNFSAGADLADFASATSLDADAPPVKLIRILAAFDKPLVAKLQGLAVGIGATLLLHCDLVYAGESARLLYPFVDLGLVPEAGSSALLPAHVGHQIASEIFLLPEPIDAARAAELRLITAVFPDVNLDAEVAKRIQRLLRQPFAAVRETKRLLRRSAAEPLAERIRAELTVFAERLVSDETRQIVHEFLDRRAVTGRHGASEDR